MADEPRNVRASADSPANFGLHRRGQGRDAISDPVLPSDRRIRRGMGPNNFLSEGNAGTGRGRSTTFSFRVPLRTYVLAFVVVGTRGVRILP